MRIASCLFCLCLGLNTVGCAADGGTSDTIHRAEAQRLAPDGVVVESVTEAKGIYRIEGRFDTDRKAVMRFGSNLMRSGEFGVQLDYFKFDGDHFRIDIGPHTPPDPNLP